MTSLSQKRAAAYHHSLGGSSHNSSLGQINLNTDELETKLDSIIANTNHDTLVNGEYNFSYRNF